MCCLLSSDTHRVTNLLHRLLADNLLLCDAPRERGKGDANRERGKSDVHRENENTCSDKDDWVFQLDLCRILIENGCSVDTLDKYGLTPLHKVIVLFLVTSSLLKEFNQAIWCKMITRLQFLILYGADIFCKVKLLVPGYMTDIEGKDSLQLLGRLNCNEIYRTHWDKIRLITEYHASLTNAVPTLQHLCRVEIRRQIPDCHFRRSCIGLPLPERIVRFLLYSDCPIISWEAQDVLVNC